MFSAILPNAVITITRNDLIKICDDFLSGKIGKMDIENYAAEAIFDVGDKYEFEDDIVAEIIFQWDNEIINFEINETNIKVWKEWLVTGENRLLEYNSWNVHIDRQKEICKKYRSDWKPINKKLKIGISENLNSEQINGLRNTSEKGTTGWFIWSGEYPAHENLFKSISAENLLQIEPKIIKYLGLETGFRFQMDRNGNEDVWKDENIKHTK